MHISADWKGDVNVMTVLRVTSWCRWSGRVQKFGETLEGNSIRSQVSVHIPVSILQIHLLHQSNLTSEQVSAYLISLLMC